MKMIYPQSLQHLWWKDIYHPLQMWLQSQLGWHWQQWCWKFYHTVLGGGKKCYFIQLVGSWVIQTIQQMTNITLIIVLHKMFVVDFLSHIQLLYVRSKSRNGIIENKLTFVTRLWIAYEYFNLYLYVFCIFNKS